jgi:hypothetical protein
MALKQAMPRITLLTKEKFGQATRYILFALYFFIKVLKRQFFSTIVPVFFNKDDIFLLLLFSINELNFIQEQEYVQSRIPRLAAKQLQV